MLIYSIFSKSQKFNISKNKLNDFIKMSEFSTHMLLTVEFLFIYLIIINECIF